MDLFRPSGGGYLSSWNRFFRLLDHWPYNNRTNMYNKKS